jgi:hypothetical protein
MSSEDQEILAKIGQLAGEFIATAAAVSLLQHPILTYSCAGKINRHKSGKPTDQQEQSNSASGASTSASMESRTLNCRHSVNHVEDPSQPSLGWRQSRGAYSPRGYGRGYSRGSRAQLHRHRTLVLNGNTPTPPNSATADSSGENSESAALNRTAAQGWVSKTDRHLQLINASIFENHSQNRAKAMEETRKQRLRQKDEREKARFNKHLYRMRGNIDNSTSVQPRSTDSSENYEISVQGIRFRVAKDGSKLIKVQGEKMRSEAPNLYDGFFFVFRFWAD